MVQIVGILLHEREWPLNTMDAYDLATPAAGVCFTNVSRVLQNILLKFVYCRNRTSYENFKLKLCMCAQSHALGTSTKFQLKILTMNMISGIVYFWDYFGELAKQWNTPLDIAAMLLTRSLQNILGLTWEGVNPDTCLWNKILHWRHWLMTSLWPSEAIWWHNSGSTMVQVMAWCLVAPNHYLNQCWFIKGVLWYSPFRRKYSWTY